jgi:hypothetical protein
VKATYPLRKAVAPEAGAPDYPNDRLADLDRLARALRNTMEHADPIGEPEWEAMSETDRGFYRKCVKDILLHTEALRRLLGR